ncbi:MAG: hypothetical protein ACK54V_01540 [Candidatus Kapaibacterium sp.]
MVVTSQDILRECTAALETLREDSSVADLRAHVLALLALSKSHLLPPHQQSLTALGSNLNTALSSLERMDPLLRNISTLISFENLPDGRPIEPTLLKAAIAAVSSVRTDDALLISRAAEAFCFQHATIEESFFLNPLLLRLIPLHGSASVLDMQCGSGLRAVQAQRRVFESSSGTSLARALRCSLEEDDRDAECRARLLAYLCGLTATMSPSGTALAPSMNSQREFDRMFVETRDRVPDIAGVLRRMGEHTICALILSDIAAGCMTKKDLSLLLDRDVLDCVVTLRSGVRAPWHVMILRGRKPVERRHRVLFYDHIDPFDGPGIDALSAETIAEACERFSSAGRHCRVLHRNDVVALGDHTDIVHDVHIGTTPEPSAVLGSAEFHELDDRMRMRGFDVHSLFRFNARDAVYEPLIADRRLLRIAVASAPALKNAEVRTHYSFAVWWSMTAPLLGIADAGISELHDTFERDISKEGVLMPRQARAIFREWWWEIDDDRTVLSLYGASVVAHTWMDALLAQAERKGTNFWFELDVSSRTLLEFLCPDLVRKLVRHDEQAESLLRSIDELAEQAPRNLAELMVRRREEYVTANIPRSRMFETAAMERMAELKAVIHSIKARMNSLHAQAKEHRTDEHRTTQFDDTTSLQDSVGALLTQIVPAQSEMKLLEKSLAPVVNLQRKRDRELMALQEFSSQLLPDLRMVRSTFSPRNARSLVQLQFRDALSRRLEAAIVANRDAIIYDLEQVWHRFDEAAALSAVEVAE